MRYYSRPLDFFIAQRARRHEERNIPRGWKWGTACDQAQPRHANRFVGVDTMVCPAPTTPCRHGPAGARRAAAPIGRVVLATGLLVGAAIRVAHQPNHGSAPGADADRLGRAAADDRPPVPAGSGAVGGV